MNLKPTSILMLNTLEELNFSYVEYYSSAYMYFALWTKNTSQQQIRAAYCNTKLTKV